MYIIFQIFIRQFQSQWQLCFSTWLYQHIKDNQRWYIIIMYLQILKIEISRIIHLYTVHERPTVKQFQNDHQNGYEITVAPVKK